MITITISMKCHWNKAYKTLTKQFNDEKPLNNYIDFMEDKGYKIVGIHNN